MRIKTIYYFLFVLLMLSACAQFSTPQGGPKDEQPPVLIEELSDSNYQVNFDRKQISLTFNEWITVSNPIKEIIVSPPTNYPFKVTEKGKTVIFEFSEKEILKEQATYQINFGDAIKDFTEGNVYKNYTYVFSTGDVIDSLSVSGSVINAVTKEPEKDVVVSLYDNLSDTAFTTVKPFYFSKTDKDGKFKISNLRSDTFQIYALKDKNVNYFYDNADEEIAFIDSTIIIEPDTILQINLALFDEENKPKLLRATQEKTGLVKIMYTPVPRDFQINLLNTDSTNTYTYNEVIKDTIMLWHNRIDLDSISLTVTNNVITDTLTVKKSKSTLENNTLVISKNNDKKFHFNDTLEVVFNHPLERFDTDSILVSDTSQTYQLKSLDIKNRSLLLSIDSLKERSNYTIQFFPSSVNDIYNNTIKDTVEYKISTHDPSSFGNIKLDFKSSIDTQYIVKLTSSSTLLDTFIISGNRTINIERVNAGQYELEIIEDINKNRYWSSGNIALKKQPERIKKVPLEELKAGWDLESIIDIKSIFNGTEVK